MWRERMRNTFCGIGWKMGEKLFYFSKFAQHPRATLCSVFHNWAEGGMQKAEGRSRQDAEDAK
jgi:hypothetical protein